LESLSPLVSTSETALRVKARSASVGVAAARATEPVTSFPVILAKGPSPERLQPPVPSPIRINATAVPFGANADRPTRAHALYRAWLNGASWDAGGRNSDPLHDGYDLHQTLPTLNIR